VAGLALTGVVVGAGLAASLRGMGDPINYLAVPCVLLVVLLVARRQDYSAPAVTRRLLWPFAGALVLPVLAIMALATTQLRTTLGGASAIALAFIALVTFAAAFVSGAVWLARDRRRAQWLWSQPW
jgi:hypothetical protein